MIKRILCIATIVTIMAIASAPAFAFYVNVLESRAVGGAQNAGFTFSGLATSTGESTAAPLAGWTGGALTQVGGSYYAGDTTPVKWGEWSFTPGTTGYYDVYTTYSNVTAAQDMSPKFTVHNAGADVITNVSQVSSGNTWVQIASGKLFGAGAAKTVREETIGTGTAGKRASFDSVAWAASAPTAVTNTEPANGATGIALTGAGNDLTWTAGNFNSFFDVFLDTNASPTTLVGSNLTALTFNPDTLPLLPGTTYHWKVVAKNVDRSVAGPIWSFTTVANLVPGIGMNNKAVRDAIMATVTVKSVFTVWGKVTKIDNNNFSVDDGASMPVNVVFTGHGLATNDYASATGTLNVGVAPPVLTAQSVKKQN